MDRDKLDFVLVGSVGVALALYLAAAILNDLGLFPFYIDTPRSDSPTLYMLTLACGLLLLLPLGFFLERQIMRCQSARRNWRTISIPSQDRSVRIGISQVIDNDEENRVRSQ